MPLEIDEGVITRALEVLYPEGIKENSRVVERQRHPRKSAVKECTPRRVPERLQCSHNLLHPFRVLSIIIPFSGGIAIAQPPGYSL